MVFDLLNSQEFLDLVENNWRGGLAEKKPSFVPIELLPRGFLIDIQYVLDVLAFSDRGFAENQAIVRKKIDVLISGPSYKWKPLGYDPPPPLYLIIREALLSIYETGKETVGLLA